MMPRQAIVQAFAKIVCYLLATVLLAAAATPPLWWAGHAVAGGGIFPFLAETDFQRYFNRAILLAALLLLWPFTRWLGIRDRAEIGLAPDPHRWRRLVAGLLLAFVPVALLGAGLIHGEVFRLKTEIPWHKLPKIALTAGAVAAVEEFLFRGAILGLVRRTAPAWVALLAVSALYSVVHFIKPEDQPLAAVGWGSGFALIPAALAKFGEPLALAGGFSTLFVLGWILGYARLRTGTLWLPVGLHAGLVLGKMGFHKITKHRLAMPPWFGDDLLVGLGPLFTALAIGLLVWVWLAYVDPHRPARTG